MVEEVITLLKEFIADSWLDISISGVAIMFSQVALFLSWNNFKKNGDSSKKVKVTLRLKENSKTMYFPASEVNKYSTFSHEIKLAIQELDNNPNVDEDIEISLKSELN